MFAIGKRSNLVVAMISLILAVILAIIVINMPASASSEPTNISQVAVVIRTHENMVIPDHVFKSQFERCSLPSREDLARQLGISLENVGQPYLGNRQVDIYGNGKTIVRIHLMKDQILFTGNRKNLKLYAFGDTFVGKGDFTFRCYNSRDRMFNPNVGSICNRGVSMLETATNRHWFTVFEDDKGSLPTAEYQYRRLAFLPSFYVPKDSEFFTNDVGAGIVKTIPTGYLTSVIPAREKYFNPWVMVDTFC